MSEMKDWSKTKVYPDVCVQTVRRAMDHLMTSFQTELKTLTTIGNYSQIHKFLLLNDWL